MTYVNGSVELLASEGSLRRLITLRTENGEQDYMVYDSVIPKDLKVSIDVFLFYLFKYFFK